MNDTLTSAILTSRIMCKQYLNSAANPVFLGKMTHPTNIYLFLMTNFEEGLVSQPLSLSSGVALKQCCFTVYGFHCTNNTFLCLSL